MKKLLLGILAGLILAGIGVGAYLFLSKKAPEKQVKRFSGINIIFFPGGSETDSFSSVVYNGAKAAQEDLGPNVEYMWSAWSTEKMAAQFKEAIDKKPDAICMMGHPGEAILAPLVDEAERNGIIVTFQNVDLPGIRQKYAAQGTGYVGQNLHDSGLMLSEGAVRKFNLKAGDKAIVLGLLGEAGRGARSQGCIDGLKKNGIDVYYKEITQEVNVNPDSAVGDKFFTDALKAQPDAKLIITDAGTVTAGTPAILKRLGKNPGDIVVAGFDLSAATVEGIKSGYIGLVHDQQPYLQGYLPVLQACLAKKYNFAGLNIDTGVGLVDNSNVDVMSELAKEKIR
jgi:simple sugar transport system substrate-binding protein